MKRKQPGIVTNRNGLLDQKKILRYFKLLNEAGMYMDKLGRNHWAIYCAGARANRPTAKVPAATVAALQSAGLISIGADGRARLCDAGRMWLARNQVGQDPFAAQHRRLSRRSFKQEDHTLIAAQVNENESPLAWLRKRRDRSGKALINEKQFEAGERLRIDFTLARMTPRTTASWSATRTRARLGRKHGTRRKQEFDHSDATLAAKRRFDAAICAVGPEFADVLVDVCCFLLGFEAAEQKFGWPRRSAKLVISLGLSALARHYEGQRGAPARRLQSWGRDGYRPSIITPLAGPAD